MFVEALSEVAVHGVEDVISLMVQVKTRCCYRTKSLGFQSREVELVPFSARIETLSSFEKQICITGLVIGILGCSSSIFDTESESSRRWVRSIMRSLRFLADYRERKIATMENVQSQSQNVGGSSPYLSGDLCRALTTGRSPRRT